MQRLHLACPRDAVLGECQVGIEFEDALVGRRRIAPLLSLLVLLSLLLQ